MGTEIKRKLASVQRIVAVNDIEGAEFIQSYQVQGWNVVGKKSEYSVGDLIVYVAIDSWVPYEIAPFLSKGKEPHEFKGVRGERLRTVKLKGSLSQGLLLSGTQCESGLSVKQYNSDMQHIFQEGDDVTDWLGIQKWEMEISAQLAGDIRGNFPTMIPKTDQERVQNLIKEIAIVTELGIEFDIEEKIEGTSSTFYLSTEGVFEVCSRNLSLKCNETNTYWNVAKTYQIEEKMKEKGLFGFAIQGEIVGPGIQGNYYGFSDFKLFVFDIYDTNKGVYLNPSERRKMVEELGLTGVPLIAERESIKKNVHDLLLFADATSKLANKKREGLVYKQSDGGMSFKVVSNSYLLSSKN